MVEIIKKNKIHRIWTLMVEFVTFFAPYPNHQTRGIKIDISIPVLMKMLYVDILLSFAEILFCINIELPNTRDIPCPIESNMKRELIK